VWNGIAGPSSKEWLYSFLSPDFDDFYDEETTSCS